METTKKILIVDDIELNRAILSELFRGSYELLEAENGVEAIKLLEEHGQSIILILLDIVMPVLDGFGVLQELADRGWSGYIPVVMITAETAEGVLQRGYEMGVVDIISKPFSPNIIRQRVHNIVEQYTYKLHLENLVDQQMDALRKQAKKLRENSMRMIDILSAVIEFKNSESVGHIRHIRTLTRLLMQKLSTTYNQYALSDELIEVISEAAAMHDIGKVAIPDQILNKPGKLTTAEFEIMKTHTLRGCEILEKLSSVQHLDYYEYYYEICRYHHERWDGLGYPDGLVGDQIPIWAQVVSLADVYDALTSKRVYKDAYGDDMAIEMIFAGECGTFNPVLLACFLTLVPALKSGAWIDTKEASALAPIPKIELPSLDKKGFAKDISGRTLHLLELERQKYRILSELSEEIFFDYDFKADKLVFSEKYQILTGRDPVISDLRSILENPHFLPKEDMERLKSALLNISLEQPACKLELRLNLNDQGLVWYCVYLYPIWDAEYEEGCVGYIGKLINIEQQKQETLKLQEAADTDSLTGILNRKALYQQVTRLFSAEEPRQGVLCFIDIDNFKALNDTFGHLYGDFALKRIALILTECAGQNDLVGRIGGDEFVVFFANLSDGQVLEQKLSLICQKLCENFADCNLSGSVGAAWFPKDGQNFETLLQRADQALYQSKLLGKNQYQIYQVQQEKSSFHSLQSAMDR